MTAFHLVLITVALLHALLHAVPAHAQGALKNVPDPDVQRQLETFRIPEGYEINLFASEPMIAKPVRMNWDEKGRLWVVGTTTYPQIMPGKVADDKVFILEDTDKDGRADKSTVFAEGLHMPTGVIPGDGGAYVANSTELLHLKDTDGDGHADERRVILSGFGQDDTHHLINTFRWGPEGRLYLNQGVYTYSSVETPWGPRRLNGAGIWQLRPQTQELDVFVRGMSNPWGHEFDEWGQSFVTDGAGSQGIYYAFPGAEFLRAVGATRTIDGLNQGHPKYAGLEILSGRHLPDSLQGQFITNDYRANRIRRFVVAEDRSGYASEPAGELLFTDHVAFRPVDVRMGPDGAIYIADWYNPIIQHGEVDFRDPRRDHRHGRIWRITVKGRPLVEPPPLASMNVRQLLDALKLPEAWTRRQAKRLLRERGAQAVAPVLAEWVTDLDPREDRYEHHVLEALWVSQSIGVVDEALLEKVITAQDPRARAAAVRVLSDWSDRVRHRDERLARAVRDEHPRVRREAVTALQRGRSAEAARTALTVLERPMDRFLDFALWKTLRELEPYWLPRLKRMPDFFGSAPRLAFALKTSADPYAVGRLARMYEAGEVPIDYREDALRTIAEYGSPEDLQLVFELALLGGGDLLIHLTTLERAAQRDRTAPVRDPERESHGMEDRVQQQAGKPVEDLQRVGRFLQSDDDQVAALAARLAGYWNLVDLQDQLVRMAEAETQARVRREAAIEGLALMGSEAGREALVEMTAADRPLVVRLLAAAALPSLDPETGAKTAADLLADVPPDTDPSVVFEALFAQREGPRLLAAALAEQEIAPEMARAGLQVIRSKGWRWLASHAYAEEARKALEAIGGPLPPPSVPQNLSAGAMDRLELDIKAAGDAARGEKIYRRSSLMCTTCHAIGGAGGKAGPDLSSLGASAPTDYIIEAILTPDEALKDGYSLVNVTKTDGSVVSGMLVRETDREVVLRDVADREVSVPASQIAESAIVPGSLMPAGLTAQLDRDEFMDLLRFLSEIGDTPALTVRQGWVRRWRVLDDAEAVRSGLREEGVAAVVREDADRLPWRPQYAMVSGDLPLDDLPVVSADDARFSFAWFELDVQAAGTVRLDVNTSEGLTLWVGGQEASAEGDEIVLNLAEGVHRVTVAVERDRRQAPLRIGVSDDSSARVQAVLGK